MKTKTQTSKEYFKMLSLIYYAMIVLQLVFGLLAYLYKISGGTINGGQDLRKTLVYIIPILVIGGFYIGNVLLKSRLAKIKTHPTLVEKMPAYRAALIMRFSLLESPFFFAIVAYLLTNDLLFLGFGGLIILIFLTIRPTKAQAILDLELDSNDNDKINDPYASISEIKVNR